MLNQHERWVFFYDTVLGSIPDEAPSIPMKDVMRKLLTRQQAGDCVKLINNDSAALRIKQMEIDSRRNIVKMLVHYADKNISDPAFSNLETGELRIEPKLEGEGVAISAHMVVSMTPKSGTDNTYLTVLEDIPGLGRTKLEPFMTSEFKEVSDFIFRDDQERERPCRPKVGMNGYCNQSLKDDLKRGALTGIELIHQFTQPSSFDEDGYTQTKQRIIRIKVNKVREDDGLSLLNRIMKKGRDLGYTNMKVKFARDEGKLRSILVGTSREDAGDALYNLCEAINVDEPLSQCTEIINEEVISKMSNLLIRMRG